MSAQAHSKREDVAVDRDRSNADSSEEVLFEDMFVNDAGYTATDQRDMQRMGKKQELMRNFRTVSSIGFTSCVMGTWEILYTQNTQALLDGGKLLRPTEPSRATLIPLDQARPACSGRMSGCISARPSSCFHSPRCLRWRE